MALRNPGNLPQGNGANSIRLQLQKPGRCGRAVSHGLLRPQTPAEVYIYAARVSSLQGMPDHLPARRAVRLRAAASARSRSRTRRVTASTLTRCAAGSRPARTRCGATATSCRSRRRRRDVLPAGWTPLLRADRLAEQLGLEEVWIKNDAANPTHSFKDRVVSVALARARELGFTTIACASTGNLANAVAAHVGRGRAGVLRVHPLRPRGAEDPRHRRLRDQPRRRQRQLRRCQPPLHRALGRARVGVREHQHAPVLRRGLQDPGV